MTYGKTVFQETHSTKIPSCFFKKNVFLWCRGDDKFGAGIHSVVTESFKFQPPPDVRSGHSNSDTEKVEGSVLVRQMSINASLLRSPAVLNTVRHRSSLAPAQNAFIKNRHQNLVLCLAAPQDAQAELESRKYELLSIIQDTQRGFVTTGNQRSSIEEALVSVEVLGAGDPINLGELDGTWRLQYTSASDVLILFESASRLPYFQVGQIFQKFECRDEVDGGVIRNVVKWSIPNLLEEQEGATLLVSAKFSVTSLRNIYLQFEEISVQNINISEELQALIAPALLPRSFLSLQFIRTFKAEFPVRNQGRRSVGGLYYLSYLDRDMLLGRSVGGGGVFVFTRAQDLVC